MSIQLVFLFSLYLIFAFQVKAQTQALDSLNLELEKDLNDTSRIQVLNALAFELSYGEKSQAVELLEESIALAQKSKYELGLSNAYSIFGLIHLDKGNHDSSQYFYLKALPYFEKHQLVEKQFNCYKKLAQLHQERNSFEQSKEYLEKLVNIADASTDETMKGNADNAYAAYLINQGWNMVDNLNDTVSYKQFFLRAKPYIYQAIAHFESANYEKGVALAYGNLCILNRDLGKLEEALSNIKRANRYFTEMNQEMYMASAYNHINTIYQQMKKYDSALLYIDKSFELAEKLESKFDLRNAYGQYSYVYYHMGDLEKYVEYHSQYDDLNHQLLEESKQALIDEMEVKYQSVKKEEELLMQEEINQKQKVNLLLLVIGSSLLVVILIILWLRNRQSSKLNALLHEKSSELELMNHEISQQRDQLKEYNELISSQHAQLDQAYHEQNNLMAVVAHDLRSPLHNVKGLNGLVKMSGQLNEEQIDYIDKTNQVVEHGLEVINDMMSLHQIESEGQTDFSRLSVQSLMDELVATHQPSATRKGSAIVLTKPTDDFSMEVNKGYFIRIMDNLISNAIKFSPKGSQIRIAYAENQTDAHFTIADQGPGFSEADKENMFKRFKKLSAQPTAGEKSSGLGLSIVKTLVDKLNGQITLSSVVGQEAIFKISIPLKAKT